MVGVGRLDRSQHGHSADDRSNSEAGIQATGVFDCCSGILSVRNATVDVGNAPIADIA